MEAKSIKQAWRMADEIFPTDYMKDERSSVAAGYDIYCSTVEGHCDYICDLGNRLEINLSNGKVVNIWIEEEEESAEPANTCTISEDVLDEAFTLLNKQMLHYKRRSAEREKSGNADAAKRFALKAERVSKVLDAICEATGY